MKYTSPIVQIVSKSVLSAPILMCSGKCGNGSNSKVF